MTMSEALERLQRLQGYAKADPGNVLLLGEAVEAALDADQPDIAADLVARLKVLAPETPATLSWEAALAMRQRRFDRAAELFEEIMRHEDSDAVRFNRAWSLAMIGEKDAAVGLLNEQVVEALASAAALRLQLIHEAGDFDGAAEFARATLPRHGNDKGFAAAVSVLALDIEDIELARACVERGGDHPDALATRGMLHLSDADPELARLQFDAAIASRHHHPRAWLGRGLAKLARHDAAGAAADIDTGAGQFGDHIGSWLAAGWAYLVAGDLTLARARFSTGLAIDEAFGESHGSLAVIDALEGNRQEAEHRIRIARRLERSCFSAALAQSLLLADDPVRAQEIIAKALATPINSKGHTIAAYMAAMAPPTLH